MRSTFAILFLLISFQHFAYAQISDCKLRGEWYISKSESNDTLQVYLKKNQLKDGLPSNESIKFKNFSKLVMNFPQKACATKKCKPIKIHHKWKKLTVQEQDFIRLVDTKNSISYYKIVCCTPKKLSLIKYSEAAFSKFENRKNAAPVSNENNPEN